MRSASDDELLVSTDPEAFGAFYGRHAANVQRYFAWRTGDRELAADLSSETFAAALLARRRFTPGGAPAEAWLYMIAARRLVDHRRRSAGEQRMREGLLGDIDEAREDERIADLLRDGVSLAMLNQLPADQRVAVGGHVLVGSGYPELSEQAGVSEAAARQRVSRGLAALRATMRAYRAAEELAGQSPPYALGAGHRAPLGSLGARHALDCSSFSSLVLKRAGLFEPEYAWTSERLAGWGEAGEGRCLTVWANDEHVWLDFRLGDRRTERFDLSAREDRHTAGGGRPAGDATPRHPSGA